MLKKRDQGTRSTADEVDDGLERGVKRRKEAEVVLLEGVLLEDGVLDVLVEDEEGEIKGLRRRVLGNKTTGTKILDERVDDVIEREVL